jgi:two-component system NtrC family response regulator
LELKDPSSAEEETSTLRASRDSREKDLVRLAMEKAGWNLSKAAAELGISRPTLYQLLARYGLKKAKSEDQKEKA